MPKAPSNATPGPTYAAPALEKGIDVIELLGDHPHGLSISEIAAHAGRSIGELFRVIVVLERRGWLHKGAGDRYHVTYKLLEAAHRATPAHELTHVAAPLMHALAARVEQSCHLVVVNGGRGMIVLRQESPGATGFAVRLGTAVDLPSSCSGHVLLAAMPEAQREALIGDAATAHTLRPRLEQVRAQGHETIASARMAGVQDMSCPVFGFDGAVVAALTIPFLTAIDAAPHVDPPDALAALKATATAISVGLGWYDRGDGVAVRPPPPLPARPRRVATAAGREPPRP